MYWLQTYSNLNNRLRIDAASKCASRSGDAGVTLLDIGRAKQGCGWTGRRGKQIRNGKRSIWISKWSKVEKFCSEFVFIGLEKRLWVTLIP
jgi:hypothetical protein